MSAHGKYLKKMNVNIERSLNINEWIGNWETGDHGTHTKPFSLILFCLCIRTWRTAKTSRFKTKVKLHSRSSGCTSFPK